MRDKKPDYSKLLRSLREQAEWHSDGHGPLHGEAADAIERLLRGPCKTCSGRGYVVHDAEWEPYAVKCPTCTLSSQTRKEG